MDMTRFILVRHGETTWNKEGRYQGQMDTPLSERGLAQGKAVAAALAEVKIDAFVTTPLRRAKETCLFCAALHGRQEVEVDARLSEIDHGIWEGKLASEVRRTNGALWAAWQTRPATVTMPQGESLAAVRVRVMAAIADLLSTYAGKTVLVVAHDAVNKVILCDILGLPLDMFWQFKQDNTCINVLEYDEERHKWRVVLLNYTGHLGYLYSTVEQHGL